MPRFAATRRHRATAARSWVWRAACCSHVAMQRARAARAVGAVAAAASGARAAVERLRRRRKERARRPAEDVGLGALVGETREGARGRDVWRSRPPHASASPARASTVSCSQRAAGDGGAYAQAVCGLTQWRGAVKLVAGRAAAQLVHRKDAVAAAHRAMSASCSACHEATVWSARLARGGGTPVPHAKAESLEVARHSRRRTRFSLRGRDPITTKADHSDWRGDDWSAAWLLALAPQGARRCGAAHDARPLQSILLLCRRAAAPLDSQQQ